MQFWETQERMKQIEQAIVILAGFIRSDGGEIARYIKNEMPGRLKSIEDDALAPVKKRKVEQLSVEELLEI
eukprot:CAMPEP_0202951686 /NCGR_PEP_ID=MMETSP1395-20130829/32847_1 /ASSEMBLY_ACC=CAM_ASM_000871 /TAXON_ID=5961 /ORGANISM="Blepharisma japonicum, Strain Stock R1072" /LENGTH=70 /DNA_ID=CAMNT_0049659509 /DNA_START=434 /DNA_END=643 /DNA_ORIENTATION=-